MDMTTEDNSLKHTIVGSENDPQYLCYFNTESPHLNVKDLIEVLQSFVKKDPSIANKKIFYNLKTESYESTFEHSKYGDKVPSSSVEFFKNKVIIS